MNSTQRFKTNRPKVIYEMFEDEVVLINLDSGNYYSLSKVGADVWGHIERGSAIAEVVADLARRYQARPEEIGSAVCLFLTQLQEEGLVSPDGMAATSGPMGGKAPIEAAATSARPPFEPPSLEKYSDMQELLLLDPIHDVDESGWPSRKPEAPGDK